MKEVCETRVEVPERNGRRGRRPLCATFRLIQEPSAAWQDPPRSGVPSVLPGGRPGGPFLGARPDAGPPAKS